MSTTPCVYIVDDDKAVRESIAMVVEKAGYDFQIFESAEQFLENYLPTPLACLVLDMNLGGMNGDQLQETLNRCDIELPIIFLTAYGDIPMTVRAMKTGAFDFLTKPVPSKVLIERIEAALDQDIQKHLQVMPDNECLVRLNTLTSREMEILPFALAGTPNKEIALKLGISHRTVEIHRIRILKKTRTANFLELAQLCETNKVLLNKSS
jgi:FixJ family two-component response regulator